MTVEELIVTLNMLGDKKAPVLMNFNGKQSEIERVYIDKSAPVETIMITNLELGSESDEWGSVWEQVK